MSNQNKQHYVPKFYLKNFSNNNYFNIYNRKNGLIENVPYKSQCYKNNFYGKDKIYENKLSVLETNWANSILNIINNPHNICETDKNNVKEFCVFQQLRTEAAYNRTQNMLFDLTSKIIPIISQFNNLQINEKDIKGYAYNYVKNHEKQEETMKRQIENAIKLSPTLNDLQLTIFINNTNIEFITSDNPIIIGNRYQTEYGLGLDCIGFYCLCPISPKYYVAIIDSKIYYKLRDKTNININETLVKKINLLQFKNSLSNIFFNDKKTYYELKKDLDYYEIAQKGKLLEEYNNKYNNFLSYEAKSFYNQFFFNVLENTNKNLICFMSKNLIGDNIKELFDVDKQAKPFQNLMNYNFHRSASLKDVKDRILLMQIGTSYAEENIKDDTDYKQQKDLIKTYEEFLYDYFEVKNRCK